MHTNYFYSDEVFRLKQTIGHHGLITFRSVLKCQHVDYILNVVEYLNCGFIVLHNKTFEWILTTMCPQTHTHTHTLVRRSETLTVKFARRERLRDVMKGEHNKFI